MNPEDLLLMVLAARLTPVQGDVFLDLTLLECSQTGLASEYGVSRAAVGQAAKRARRKLQAAWSLRMAA